ncbi:unnamed protein product, partial [Lampetra fluviatilis]
MPMAGRQAGWGDGKRGRWPGVLCALRCDRSALLGQPCPVLPPNDVVESDEAGRPARHHGAVSARRDLTPSSLVRSLAGWLVLMCVRAPYLRACTLATLHTRECLPCHGIGICESGGDRIFFLFTRTGRTWAAAAPAKVTARPLAPGAGTRPGTAISGQEGD